MVWNQSCTRSKEWQASSLFYFHKSMPCRCNRMAHSTWLTKNTKMYIRSLLESALIKWCRFLPMIPALYASRLVRKVINLTPILQSCPQLSQTCLSKQAHPLVVAQALSREARALAQKAGSSPKPSPCLKAANYCPAYVTRPKSTGCRPRCLPVSKKGSSSTTKSLVWHRVTYPPLPSAIVSLGGCVR